MWAKQSLQVDSNPVGKFDKAALLFSRSSILFHFLNDSSLRNRDTISLVEVDGARIVAELINHWLGDLHIHPSKPHTSLGSLQGSLTKKGLAAFRYLVEVFADGGDLSQDELIADA